MTVDTASRTARHALPGEPRHALSFDMEAVHVMEREAGTWAWRGAARYDSSDLASRLAVLRRAVDGLDAPDGAEVALIIPDDQVLFTDLEVDPALPRREAIARSLDGLTPYAVEDLDFDWQDSSTGRVQVAAVWRETLHEAEAFATAHGFRPVATLADPEGEHFARPVQFNLAMTGTARPRLVVSGDDAMPAGTPPVSDTTAEGEAADLDAPCTTAASADSAPPAADDGAGLAQGMTIAAASQPEKEGNEAAGAVPEAAAPPQATPEASEAGEDTPYPSPEQSPQGGDAPQATLAMSVTADGPTAENPAPEAPFNAGGPDIPANGGTDEATAVTSTLAEAPSSETAVNAGGPGPLANGIIADATAVTPTPADAPAEISASDAPVTVDRAGPLGNGNTADAIVISDSDANAAPASSAIVIGQEDGLAGTTLPPTGDQSPVPVARRPEAAIVAQPSGAPPRLQAQPVRDQVAMAPASPKASGAPARVVTPLDESLSRIRALSQALNGGGAAVNAPQALPDLPAPQTTASDPSSAQSEGRPTSPPVKPATNIAAKAAPTTARTASPALRARNRLERLVRAATGGVTASIALGGGGRAAAAPALDTPALASPRLDAAPLDAPARPIAPPVSRRADPRATTTAATEAPETAADARARAFHERARATREADAQLPAEAHVPVATGERAAARMMRSSVERHGTFYILLGLLVLGLAVVLLLTPNHGLHATDQTVTQQSGTHQPVHTPAAPTSNAAPTASSPSVAPSQTPPSIPATATTAGADSSATSPAAPAQDTALAATPSATAQEAAAPVTVAPSTQPVIAPTAAAPVTTTASPPAAPTATAPTNSAVTPAPAPARPSTAAAPQSRAIDAAVSEAVSGAAGSRPAPIQRPASEDARGAPVAPARPAVADSAPVRPRNPLPFNRASEAEPATVSGRIRPKTRPAARPAAASTAPAAANTATNPAPTPAAVSASPSAGRPAVSPRPRLRPEASATPAPTTTGNAVTIPRPARREGALSAPAHGWRLAAIGDGPDAWGGAATLDAFAPMPVPARAALRLGLANDRALLTGPRGPRLAQSRPPARDADQAILPPPAKAGAKKPTTPAKSGGSKPRTKASGASAVDAAVAEAAASGAAPAPKGRPQGRPAAETAAAPSGKTGTKATAKTRAGSGGGKGVDAAIAEAIEESPASPGGVALTSLKSSPFPERAPRAGRSTGKVDAAPDADAAAAAVAAAAAARPQPTTPAPAAAAPAPGADADAARQAERMRLDDELQRQAEARIRARATADARVEAQQRAAAEARARAQAAAEERAAAARRQPVVPTESDNEPDATGPVGGGASNATVAARATSGGLDLRRTTLIGVIGAGPASRGLIRLGNGRIVTVRLGDRIDGGPITDIGKGAVTYVSRGQTRQLRILDGR